MHTPSQAVWPWDVGIAGQQVKNVGARGCARGQKVIVFTSHRDDLQCDGSWGGLVDTTTRENSNGMCQAFSTWMCGEGLPHCGFSAEKKQTCSLASQRQIFDFKKTVKINVDITARMFALVMSQYSIKRYIRGFNFNMTCLSRYSLGNWLQLWELESSCTIWSRS